MRRRIALCAGIGASLGSVARRVASQPRPARIVFLNPGEAVEGGKGPQWRMTSRFMNEAARIFGFQLEVLFAERDHLLMLRQAEEVAQRGSAPDYVVIVNEKLAGPSMLRLFERTGSRILLIHNDLTAEQRAKIGNEREQLRNWIGTVTTDERHAGFRLMQELVHQLGEREPQVIGITGDRGTPVSLERAEGVSQFITRSGRGTILQTVFSDWSAADAESKAAVLLARHPNVNIIWAANDTMALGAQKAVQAQGARVLVGGTGAWPAALASIEEGGLAASAGSHFFIGAWAMVLLYDYHRGLDFARHGGVNQKLDYIYVVNRDNAARYRHAVYEREGAFDFSAYSKVLHPKPGPYDFNLRYLLRS